MRFNKVKMRLIYGMLLLLAFGPRAEAQTMPFGTVDSSKPIEITADTLEVVQKDRLATFAGEVQVVQGRMIMESDKMYVYYRDRKRPQKDQPADEAPAISRIDVVGNVFLTTPEESARSQRGIYDVDNKMVYLLGNVQLSKGENVIKGDRLDYNLTTGKSRISTVQTTTETGEKKKERVRGIFVPGQ